MASAFSRTLIPSSTIDESKQAKPMLNFFAPLTFYPRRCIKNIFSNTRLVLSHVEAELKLRAGGCGGVIDPGSLGPAGFHVSSPIR